MTEAAGEHKGDVWKTPTDVLPERYAVETGHDHVAEYNIEALRFLVDQLQRLFRVGSKHRLVTEITKELRGELADLGIVLHHENLAARPRDRRSNGSVFGRLNGL